MVLPIILSYFPLQNFCILSFKHFLNSMSKVGRWLIRYRLLGIFASSQSALIYNFKPVFWLRNHMILLDDLHNCHPLNSFRVTSFELSFKHDNLQLNHKILVYKCVLSEFSSIEKNVLSLPHLLGNQQSKHIHWADFLFLSVA